MSQTGSQYPVSMSRQNHADVTPQIFCRLMALTTSLVVRSGERDPDVIRVLLVQPEALYERIKGSSSQLWRLMIRMALRGDDNWESAIAVDSAKRLVKITRHLLSEFNAGRREALVLHMLGKSDEQISRRLGRTERTVSRVRQRAHQLLQSGLQ